MNRFTYQPHVSALQPLFALSKSIHASSIEPALRELVQMRVSQINGCAFCLDMHSKDARAAGETEQRLHLLPVWRETRLYSARERAALAWAEALTGLNGPESVSDALYEEARAQFSEEELVKLTVLIGTINAWDRLAISFRAVHPTKTTIVSA